ncbi:c-type cytochrome [Motiliproteus sediminis]|uniref:c-type cytochrome n=1 Tax=Motiliproteus sediminis TaxID=1468178 RepID=UPI001AEFA4B4|nr:c-type cytochrome [Motiliproteus sediminis]
MKSGVGQRRIAATAVTVLGALSVISFAKSGSSSLPAEPYGKDSAAGACVVCHSLEKNGPYRSAPNLWGVVDAPKARADWFGYSIALKKKGGQWTEQELDEFFASPSAFVPGTKKTMNGITDPDQRAELIDYLKTLRD